MQISEDTRDVIRQLLRGYRKGYAFDLNDYAVNIEMPESTLGVILADLCQLGNEDFKLVASYDSHDVKASGFKRSEQWRAPQE